MLFLCPPDTEFPFAKCGQQLGKKDDGFDRTEVQRGISEGPVPVSRMQEVFNLSSRSPS